MHVHVCVSVQTEIGCCRRERGVGICGEMGVCMIVLRLGWGMEGDVGLEGDKEGEGKWVSVFV